MNTNRAQSWWLDSCNRVSGIPGPIQLPQGEVFESELALRPEARSSGRKQGVRQVNHWVGQPDPERGNVNDCAVAGVLRRYRGIAWAFLAR
jgi:hypothetical protein